MSQRTVAVYSPRRFAEFESTSRVRFVNMIEDAGTNVACALFDLERPTTLSATPNAMSFCDAEGQFLRCKGLVLVVNVVAAALGDDDGGESRATTVLFAPSDLWADAAEEKREQGFMHMLDEPRAAALMRTYARAGVSVGVSWTTSMPVSELASLDLIGYEPCRIGGCYKLTRSEFQICKRCFCKQCTTRMSCAAMVHDTEAHDPCSQREAASGVKMGSGHLCRTCAGVPRLTGVWGQLSL